LQRQALHAEKLHFVHPTKGKNLNFTSALPDDLARLRMAFGQRGGATEKAGKKR